LKGYCLNDASTISDNPQSECQLKQPAFLSFFNCALYFACDKDEKAIKAMMFREPAEPKDFFWSHLNKDLMLIGQALNLNPDEVLIILHSRIFKNQNFYITYDN
jgi:hypothetical protein